MNKTSDKTKKSRVQKEESVVRDKEKFSNFLRGWSSNITIVHDQDSAAQQ
jgi:hypothetical protein